MQCLRGIAAILVLLFHFAPQLERYGLSHILPGIGKWGFWGVDIFFVLSGFVIALSSERLFGGLDGFKFILKRSLRVFLGYWPALALWMGAAGILGWSINDNKLLVSWFLLSGSMTDYALPIAWSLYYELLFYVVFFALIVLVAPRLRSIVIQIGASLLLAWCLAWIVFWPEDVMAGIQPYRGVLSAYALEFFAGVFIYKARTVLAGCRLAVAPLLMFAFTALVVGAQSPWFDKIEILRAGTYGFAAVAVVAAAVCLEGGAYSKALCVIGDSSYSLYLTHIFIINLMTDFVVRFFGFDSWLGELTILLTPFIAVVFAIFWYRLIERPIYDKSMSVVAMVSAWRKPINVT